MSNSIAPGSSADVNVKVTALTTNPNVPAQYKTIILKKNLVNGVNTLTQKMMSATNTKYIIKYNYILGENITVPKNCILEFDGGCFSNGTLNFNSTKIVSNNKCFSTDITFGDNGWISNEEVLISWFVAKSDIMVKEDPVHDCHDEIRLASLLAGHINSGHLFRRGGVLNLECIQLAVMQPIILDNQLDGNLIKNANIHFWSTANGQSIIHYNNNSISYCPIENSVFAYYGSVETKNIKDVSKKIYHERINAIRFEKCSPTVFSYWRDIKTSMLTGYVFVNQVYLQEEIFENITSSGGNGFISYNVDHYYEGTAGSSNILEFRNCNLNNGNTAVSYKSKLTYEYIWDFCSYIELTIINAVSQGYGSDNKKIIRLGGSSFGPIAQTVTLDGFWIEYTYFPADNRIYIGSSTDLHLKKQNISGFVTLGNHENITIYNEAVGEDFYNTNFIDNSEINKGTSNVIIYYEVPTYRTLIKLSDKFLDWIDKGIIRTINTRKTPNQESSKMPSVYLKNHEETDFKDVLIRSIPYNFYLDRNKNPHLFNAYVSHYNNIPTVTFEVLENHYIYVLGSTTAFSDKSGMYFETVYRYAPMIDVTEDTINNISVSYLDAPFKFEIGTKAGTWSEWKRYALIRNTLGGNLQIKNCKIEIAYCKLQNSFVIRNYKNFNFTKGNINLEQREHKTITYVYFSTQNTNEDYVISLLPNIVKIDNVLIQVGTQIYYKDNNKFTPLNSIYGTTAKRPKHLAIGSSYFDTTLGKPIYVKTVDSTTGDITWVDATGETV